MNHSSIAFVIIPYQKNESLPLEVQLMEGQRFRTAAFRLLAQGNALEYERRLIDDMIVNT